MNIQKVFMIGTVCRGPTPLRTGFYTVNLCRKRLVGLADHRGIFFERIRKAEKELHPKNKKVSPLSTPRPRQNRLSNSYSIDLQYTFTVYGLEITVCVLVNKNRQEKPRSDSVGTSIAGARATRFSETREAFLDCQPV